MILTCDELIESQERWLQDLQPTDDLDPIINALRLPCHIVGDSKLFDGYVDRLHKMQSESAEKLGNYLLSCWEAPEPFKGSFDAKQDLYRPITLLIDALSVKHNIPQIRTDDRIEALRDFLPNSLIALLERTLRFACRLRLLAHIHYGEESETVYLDPDKHVDKPLLLTYADWKILDEVDALLSTPLVKIADRHDLSLSELGQ